MLHRSVALAIAMAAVAMVETAGAASATSAPTGLMANFQRSPSLGVTTTPQFTWVVPSCPGAADQNQVAFAIAVTEEAGGKTVWNSGKVTSPNRSAHSVDAPRVIPFLFRATVATPL